MTNTTNTPAVTRQSAIAAIDHLDRSNSPGRRRDAVAMLESISPAVEQSADMAAEDTERLLRTGRNLHDLAKRSGWPDDGEGAMEFVVRHSYELGHSDAIAASRRTAGNARGDALREAKWRFENILERGPTVPTANDANKAIAAIDAALAAPVSAGQAAPFDTPEFTRKAVEWARTVTLIKWRGDDDKWNALVSAGQAGQVADAGEPQGFSEWFTSWADPSVGWIETNIKRHAALSAWRKATESAATPERSDTPASHIEETRELIEAAERMMRWCVTNVDKWNFSQWDDLDRAVSRLKARIDGNNQGAAEGAIKP